VVVLSSQRLVEAVVRNQERHRNIVAEDTHRRLVADNNLVAVVAYMVHRVVAYKLAVVACTVRRDILEVEELHNIVVAVDYKADSADNNYHRLEVLDSSNTVAVLANMAERSFSKIFYTDGYFELFEKVFFQKPEILL